MKLLSIVCFPKKNGNPAYYRFCMLTKLFKASYEEVDTLELTSYKGNYFLKKAKEYFAHKKEIIKFLSNKSYDAIFLHTLDSKSMSYLKKYASAHNIKLIYDCVEWASASEKKLGVFSPSYISNHFRNQSWVDKRVNVISISSYLHSYFASKGINSIIIPNMVDPHELPLVSKTKNDRLNIIFVGYPQKKDLLSNMIHGLLLLNDESLRKIIFTVIGIDFVQMINMCKLSKNEEDRVSQFVIPLGMINHDEIAKYYSKADFSFFIRNGNKRVARAGFPTKLVESFAHATPVICNLSSDIGLYLKDGYNGFIVDGFDSESIARKMQSIIDLNLSFEEIKKMSDHARDTAIDSFDYHLFINSLKTKI